MSALTLPEPSSVAVADVPVLSAQVVEWVESVDDITIVREAAHRWAGITEYVRRKSMTGIAEAEAALRKLEQRTGVLMQAMRAAGELASKGRPPTGNLDTPRLKDIGISYDEAAACVAFAENPEIVAEVIAKSTDARPASRNAVLGAIARKKDEADLAAAIADGERLAPVILDAIAALPVDDGVNDWIVTLRFTATHIDDVKFALPDNAEVISIQEAQ